MGRTAKAMPNASAAGSGKGIKTGAQFLASLRDGRELWFKGKRIEDITAFPAFQGVCGTLAGLYDMQHQSATQDAMTFLTDDGMRASASYLLPTTREQLAHRRRNHEIWGRETFGMMGRNPDFCGGIMVGLADLAPALGKLNPAFAANVKNYIRLCQEQDFCLTHGLHDPNMDKTQRPKEDPDRCLRIVKKTKDGYIVRGARYATLAPFANEILVYPSYMLKEDEDEFAIWFALPMNTKGMRIVCRDSYSIGRDKENFPLSVRFDEQDALVIFDDVLVPHDRVFLAENAKEAVRLYRAGLMRWASYAGGFHVMERYKLFVGVAHLLAETAGIADRPRVAEDLGELVTLQEMYRQSFLANEAAAEPTPAGLWGPKANMSTRAFAILISETMTSLIEHLGTGAMIFNNSSEDFDTPVLGPLLEIYGRGKGIDARSRQKLSRLAFELVGDAFGSRQQLYERLHSGDPYLWMGNAYRSYDKKPGVEAVNRLLGTTFKA